MTDISTNLSKLQREKLLDICSRIKNNDTVDITEVAELEQFIKSLKYGLNFEQHEEQIDKMLKTSIPILKEFKEVINNPESTECNFLIEGDNLHSLKLLEKTHKGKIDVIYIDPPYNTGAEDWRYNNNYVSSEDGFKHSKWLSMMKERVLLSKKLLKPSGILICAIDHFELFPLGMLLDEIFGEENRLGIVSVVHKAEGRNQEKFFATSNEFALFYSRNIQECNFQSVILDDDILDTYDLSDDIGVYKLNNYIRVGGGDKNLRKNKPNSWYPIYVSTDLSKISLKKEDDFIEIWPITKTGTERTWKTKKETTQSAIEANELVAVKEDDGTIMICEKYRKGQLIKTHWVNSKYNATSCGTKVLEKIMGYKSFNYPKSLYLMKDIIKITAPKDGTILDFFAGSGTTGHAVLELNKEDGGNRKFILCTNNEISSRYSLKYLQENGYLLDYSPSAETKNTTIQKKIDTFFEQHKEVYKKLILDSKDTYETYGICQAVTFLRLKTVILGIREDKSKYSDGIKTNLRYLQTDMVDKENDDLDEILYDSASYLAELDNMSMIDGKKIRIADCDEDIEEIINNPSDELKILFIADDIMLSLSEKEFFINKGIQIKQIPNYYYKEI